jgi:predicted histidine transporter YuiF (NhaC family)
MRLVVAACIVIATSALTACSGTPPEAPTATVATVASGTGLAICGQHDNISEWVMPDALTVLIAVLLILFGISMAVFIWRS